VPQTLTFWPPKNRLGEWPLASPGSVVCSLELDLVQPLRSRRRFLDRPGKLGGTKSGSGELGRLRRDEPALTGHSR
jgi:hypothetical protein